MTREWQIWVCSVCPMIMEYVEDDGTPYYCSGDGCGPYMSGFEPQTYSDGAHKQTKMEIVKVQEIK